MYQRMTTKQVKGLEGMSYKQRLLCVPEAVPRLFFFLAMVLCHFEWYGSPMCMGTVPLWSISLGPYRITNPTEQLQHRQYERAKRKKGKYTGEYRKERKPLL